jgi:hypothetical protein
MIECGRGHAHAGKRSRARAASSSRWRRRLSLFLLCLIIALFGDGRRALSDDALTDDATQSAAAEPASVVVGLADGLLTLPIPPGYCAIAPTSPDLAESFASVEASFGKGTCLLAWFVECGALEAVRAGKAPTASLFADYGIYVTPINDDGVFQQFPGMPRTTFVRQVASTMPPLDRDLLSITVARSPSIPDKTDSGLRMSTREIGLLNDDAYAYYLATAAELTLNDERRALLGVAATTLVHRVAVSTIVYGGPNGAGTIEMLEERARAATLSLIAINPGGDGSDRLFAFDANRLALIGFGIGLVFIAIGLVNMAWRYWCRRHGIRP